MKIACIVLGIAGLLAMLIPGMFFYFNQVANPRIARELAEDPDGQRARKVMLLTLPSGREIPVNYLRESDRVYAGADGRWWKELVGDGFAVTVFLRGETLRGTARAVLDDPSHTKDVFSRLRPTAVPGFGTLIEIQLEGESSSG